MVYWTLRKITGGQKSFKYNIKKCPQPFKPEGLVFIKCVDIKNMKASLVDGGNFYIISYLAKLSKDPKYYCRSLLF